MGEPPAASEIEIEHQRPTKATTSMKTVVRLGVVSSPAGRFRYTAKMTLREHGCGGVRAAIIKKNNNCPRLRPFAGLPNAIIIVIVVVVQRDHQRCRENGKLSFRFHSTRGDCALRGQQQDEQSVPHTHTYIGSNKKKSVLHLIVMSRTNGPTLEDVGMDIDL